MTYFKRTIDLTNEEMVQVSEMAGKIVLWVLEGRSTKYMADQLHLKPYMVYENIEEVLYILRKRIGVRRFVKTLFWK